MGACRGNAVSANLTDSAPLLHPPSGPPNLWHSLMMEGAEAYALRLFIAFTHQTGRRWIDLSPHALSHTPLTTTVGSEGEGGFGREPISE